MNLLWKRGILVAGGRISALCIGAVLTLRYVPYRSRLLSSKTGSLASTAKKLTRPENEKSSWPQTIGLDFLHRQDPRPQLRENVSDDFSTAAELTNLGWE